MTRLLLTATLSLSLVGCPTTPEPVAAPPYVPTYSFNPPTSEAGKGISIAMVKPQLSDDVKTRIAYAYARAGKPVPVTGGEDSSYRAMRDGVGRALLQYFTASGFTISGPFDSVDTMTFPEKKQADLLLTVDFGVLTDSPAPYLARNSDGSVSGVSSKGDCTVAGAISFVLWEPLSMQRMWTKSVDVTPSTFDCNYLGRDASAYNVMIANGFNHAYEEIFRNTMTAAVRYFDPQEVALVKSQEAELREKKVY